METENNKKLNMAEEVHELRESIEDLQNTISNVNSTKKVVTRGIIAGLSSIIGATIIFGLLLALISGILYKTGISPRLNAFLNDVTKKK